MTVLIVTLTNSGGAAVRFGVVLGGGLGFSSYTGFGRVESCHNMRFMQPLGRHPATALVRFFHEITPLFTEPLLLGRDLH